MLSANEGVALNSTHTKLAIVGFPKCGTSALTRAIGSEPDMKMLLRRDGQIEVTWPLVKELELAEEEDPDVSVTVHKWTAYVYNKGALEYLAEDSTRKFVLCVRDPLKALVSWHNMHRRIAEEGRLTNHFAFKNRDFYMNCSVDEYFEEFAATRLEYDKHFNRLLSFAGAERTLVLSQEKMAESMESAVAACRALCGLETPAVDHGGSERHVSYADRAESHVSQAIQDQLHNVRERLSASIAEAGVAALV